MHSLDWGITYDAARLTIQADTLHVGDFGGDVSNLTNWTGTCNTTNPGEIHVDLSSDDGSYFTSDSVDVLRLTFHVASNAPAEATPLAFDLAQRATHFNGGGLGAPGITPVNSSIIVTTALGVTVNGPTTGPEGSALSYTSSIIGPDVSRSYTWTVTKDGSLYSVANNTDSTFSFVPDDNATYVTTLS